MSSYWKSQQNEGKYTLQFETDDKEKYVIVEKTVQAAIDDNLQPIVRCKKCENWEEERISTYLHYPMSYPSGRGFCTHLDTCHGAEYCYTDENHFCSAGKERKHNAEK